MAEILKDVLEDEKGNQHYLVNNTETTFDKNGTPLNDGGDLSEASVNFTVSSSRKALTAKARFKALMGDIAKWLTDLGPAAFYKVADDFTTTAENYLFTARKGKQLKDEVDNLNQNLQELQEGMMKIATKTVTVTTGDSGNTYQNEIDLNDMGLDVSKIVACYFEPSNAQLRLGSTAGGICTIAKDYNTATGKLLLSIGTTQHCLAMTWTGTVIAITA